MSQIMQYYVGVSPVIETVFFFAIVRFLFWLFFPAGKPTGTVIIVVLMWAGVVYFLADVV